MCPKSMKLGRVVLPGGPSMRHVRGPLSVPSFPVTVMRNIRLRARIGAVTL
ncbi:hypothetical protein DPMN_186661 [Dreissena polymorpha]|uniref:Uncharacterized protein n=1 Tax=Dreissena polymorpha TaxID=45954 RepID=A0A9D4DN03_DREPO|nr:hypothetical protein DPMN_186661 [Dreissena polymorpha]